MCVCVCLSALPLFKTGVMPTPNTLARLYFSFSFLSLFFRFRFRFPSFVVLEACFNFFSLARES